MTSKTILLLVSLLLTTASAMAQRMDSVLLDWAGYRNSLWLAGQNAASLTDWQQPDYGTTRTGYDYTAGRFRRPQEPLRRNDGYLHSEGLRRMNGWRFGGWFRYRKNVDRQIRYSGVYDPYNGNPFVWADTLPGDWQRDHIQTQVAVGTPALRGRWHLGVSVDYHIGQGARRNEPKPLYRYRNIRLAPSVTWRPNPNTVWGMVLKVGFVQEENETGFFSLNFPLLYRLRGYGTFSRSPVVTAERRTGGTHTQLLVQWLTNRPGGTSWLAQAGGGLRRETVREGIANPVEGGFFREWEYAARLRRTRPVSRDNRIADLQINVRNGAGRDPIVQAFTARYTQAEAAGAWGQTRQTESCFTHWFVRPNLQLWEYEDQIARTEWRVVNATLTAEWQQRFRWKKAWGWYKLEAGYRTALDSRFVASRPTELTPVLVRPDFRVHEISALLTSATAGVDFQTARFPALWHRLTASVSAQTTGDATLGSRQAVSVHYAVIY